MDARIAFEVNRSVIPRLPDFLMDDAAALVASRNDEFREIFEAPILKEVERLRIAHRDPAITPVQFERWCIETLKWSGWTASGTKASGDQGADVIATKSGLKVVIQCKLFSRPVGNFAVQEVFAAKAYYGAQGAAVVSNQVYTPAAHKLARSCGVKLMHADDLLKVNTIAW